MYHYSQLFLILNFPFEILTSKTFQIYLALCRQRPKGSTAGKLIQVKSLITASACDYRTHMLKNGKNVKQ